MKKKRLFYVSYHFQQENKNYGYGSCWLNLTQKKLTREALQQWKIWLEKEIKVENIIILSFHELEG